MERLTKAEEPVMQLLWKLKKAFVKELIEEMPEPKPPYNTISSIIRILEEKGMVDHQTFGKTHQYFPKMSKLKYSQGLFKYLMSDYLEGSYSRLMSFIVDDKKLSEEEIRKLQDMINKDKDE
ncbi:MAG: BlaI/MecI/CopY family transcriptional regulator [Bacteroidota bacterium]